MKTFESVNPMDIKDNIIHLIGKEWMLITAGNLKSFNTMTASWGGMGYLWNKEVAFVFIRPQRYTFEFTEKEDVMTLSFFNESHRKALNICGSTSGRDTNKVKIAGLNSIETANGSVSLSEASLIIEGTKLYSEFLNPQSFFDKELINTIYKASDFHKMYIIEITKAWKGTVI